MSKHADLKRIATAIDALQAPPAARNTSTPGKDKLPIRAHLALMIGGSQARALKHRNICRTYPIRAKVGPNGGGKSLSAVDEIIASLDRGRHVLSTVRLIDSRTGDTHPLYEQFYDFDQLTDARKTTVFMDEVTGIANSRSSSSLSTRVQNKLVQLRRDDCDLIWTAPNWARADVIIREVTQAVTECRGYFAGRQRMIDGEIRQWAPKRVFRFRTYDVADFEEWTAGKREKLDPIASVWYKGIGSRAFASYDTLESVSMVAHASEAGVCEICEKTVRREYCKGHTPAERSAEPDALPEVIDLVDRAHHAGIDAYAMVNGVAVL